MMSGNNQREVDITKLPIHQLQSFRGRLEEEIQLLANSYGTLKTADAKFTTSLGSLEVFTPGNKDKEIMVPLSGSLYVPGKVSNVESVIVDVGTGYFVEKSPEQAKDYYKSKLDYLKANIDKLQETMAEKQKIYNMVIQVMQEKFAQIESSSSSSKK